MTCYVIGIDDNRNQEFSPEVRQIISSHRVFSGGARHREIVTPYLPQNHRWIEIVVPLAPVLEFYRQEESVVVFASGDPLFFGFANTLLRDLPEASIKVYPSFNSLQLLAHRLLMPYQDMQIVSLTGRPWRAFDQVLIEGVSKIGILTDNKLHTPKTIAQRMLDYGYDNYKMSVGELLGNPEKERVRTFDLTEIEAQEFLFPNNIILRQTYAKSRPLGISEELFYHLNGRRKMITKMPIRLLSLSLLDLRSKNVFWDIGFCTGSVSIEAKMQFPLLDIYAFEIREEGKDLMEQNSRRFGTPGINCRIGDFAEMDLSDLPSPDAVFIGGHGGKMREIVEIVTRRICPGGILVFNSVSAESQDLFVRTVEELGWTITQTHSIQIDENNPIFVFKAERKNTLPSSSCC